MSANARYQVSPDTKFTLFINRSRSNQGDLARSFEPGNIDPLQDVELDATGRLLGFQHAISPNSQILAQVAHGEQLLRRTMARGERRAIAA